MSLNKKEVDFGSDFDSEQDKGKRIIDAKTSATIATTNI
jgi:hypothetical protein